MKPITFGSVCSGIEAASSAWIPLGWQCAFMSEIERFPRAVLSHHYPKTPLHGDFTTIKAADYAAIDVLVGGTPCQSFSVAGLRGGMADERGNLALEYLCLADRLRPRWVVWENVTGVLSSKSGRDFGSFLGGLVKLGYGFAYRVLDAQYFGLAQRRKRVFVVGYLGDWRRAVSVLFEPSSLCWNPAPRREAGQRPAPTTSSRPTGCGDQGADFDIDGGLISRCLTAHPARMDAESETFVTHSLRGVGFDASEDGSGRGTPLIPVSVALRGRDGGATAELGDDLAFALRASGGGGDKPHVLAFDCKASGQSGFGLGKIAGTQRAMGHADSHTNGGGHQVALVGSAVRRLTPRECERLQGFPDDYTAIPYRGKAAADGPRYKALGNSMAVPCMRWIGQRIQNVDRISA